MVQPPSAARAAYLKNLGLTAFNDMQITTAEKAVAAPNLMLLAPTGSGKTLAFLLPLTEALKTEGKGVQALVVAPSRELCLQIEQVFRQMKTSFRVCCCYGGHAMKVEQNSLNDAPEVVIGTPGRLADHLTRGSFDPRTVSLVVLDEFDKSLQMGFHEQLRVIFNALSGKQRHLLTSATRLENWPDFLPFTKPQTLDYLKDEKLTRLELKLVRTTSVDKVETLMRLVAGFNQEVCLVFCNHRDAVERISALLADHNIAHGMLHGAMEQIDREKNMIKFRAGANTILIATDLASRGLDVPEIRHVVHYQLPPTPEAFLHRNGRTARMHADGQAYLVLANDETLPPYIDKSVEEIFVDRKLKKPQPPAFTCLYISAGKKDKISKGDIVGLLTKKGGLQPEDIGLIATLDYSSYVAVKRPLVDETLARIKNEKLKNTKVKIEVAS